MADSGKKGEKKLLFFSFFENTASDIVAKIFVEKSFFAQINADRTKDELLLETRVILNAVYQCTGCQQLSFHHSYKISNEAPAKVVEICFLSFLRNNHLL